LAFRADSESLGMGNLLNSRGGFRQRERNNQKTSKVFRWVTEHRPEMYHEIIN